MITRAILILVMLLAAGIAPAKTLRWSAQADPFSMDPHGQADVFSDSVNALAYEYLVTRGKDYSIVPALAVSWANPAPNRWILNLRRDVRFHDGTPFTADDVVFSFQRARRTPYRWYALQVGEARKIDEHTVELVTPVPNPAQLDMLAVLFVMSRSWCEKHDCSKPREGYIGRHAMGTGPFRLVSFEPGIATRHARNPEWWGIREGLFEGNVEAIEFRPLASPATRLSALVSGQVDFLLDVPVQDVARLEETPGIRVWRSEEMRVTNLVMDQARPELLYSTVKGSNPFRDRRVRLALYQAIDPVAVRDQVMRGFSRVTAIALPGAAKLGMKDGVELRHPYDPARARALLAEAGYPNGFGFTLHCPNDRWMNDERLCTAVAAMWSRIGLDVRVEAIPKAQFFPRASKREISAGLSAWGGNSEQAIFILKPVMHTPSDDGAGSSNFGSFSHPPLDRLIRLIEVEFDPVERQKLVEQAARMVHDEVLLIPLHRQVVPWASRNNVTVVPTPNNWLVPIWVKVN